MASFEDFCPKTQAWNVVPAGAILFQFQKFQNLAHDPRFFCALEAEIFRKGMKIMQKEQKFMPQFWDRISQNQP